MTAEGRAIRLGVLGREVRIRDTFELAVRLEERFGSLFNLILKPRSDVPLADVLGILEEILIGRVGCEDFTREDLKRHISAVGIGGVWRQIAYVMNVIAEGWSALNEEASAAAAENPPKPKRGRKSKASPGPTSSGPQASSVSAPPSSGAPLPLSSQPSGEHTPGDPALAFMLNGAAS